jgi:hypothetical protein
VANVLIFLSTVSKEFGSYREALRRDLARPNVTVMIQEDFIVTGTETLDMLDRYVENCDAVIHVVGDMTGAMAQAPSVEAIHSRHPDFATRFPPIARYLEADGPKLSYTQWEAWLALYHRRLLIIAVPEKGARRDAACRDKAKREAERAAQRAHLALLAQVERFPGFTFKNADRLAVGVLRSGLHDILAAANPIKAPMMAPNMPDMYEMVGRKGQIADIRQSLLDGKPRSIAIKLIPGIGKTALACFLANDAELQKHFSGGVLWAHLGSDPDIRNELHRWAEKLCGEGQQSATIGNASEGSQDYWQGRVKEALAERRSNTLLVVDDVWKLEHGKAFKIGGNSCSYLFTTRFPEIAKDLAGKVIELVKLDADSAIDLLRQFASEVVDTRTDEVRSLVVRVGGLPQALILLGCILRDASRNHQNRRVDEALANLEDTRQLFEKQQEPEYSGDVPRSLSSMIEASYRWLGSGDSTLDGDMLRRTVESLAVLRPDPSVFCENLAARMAGATPQALNALCDTGLIEGRGDYYTMHRTISEYLQTKLGQERRNELHAAARDFYRERLNDIEEVYQKRDSQYGFWYRYEDRDWGDAEDEWLYHLSRCGDYRTIVIAFLRAWFDGFWWWGCFLDFHFCDQLLREWQQREVRPESREGLRLLVRFMEVYPKEAADSRDGNWTEIASILDRLRSWVGIAEGDALPSEPDALHLRGLTSILLAEARRFGARDYADAERLYRDALKQFIDNRDDWDIAWTCYHLADMLVEARRYAEAEPFCRIALPLGEREKDPEVQANLWRVLGDIGLANGNVERAGQAFGFAVQEAYRFQVDPEEPDPYTICFYAKIAERVSDRLINLHQRCPDAALSLMTELHAGWCAAGDNARADFAAALGGPVQLAAALFPPSLPASQLKAEGKRYADQVRTRMTTRRTRTGQP